MAMFDVETTDNSTFGKAFLNVQRNTVSDVGGKVGRVGLGVATLGVSEVIGTLVMLGQAGKRLRQQRKAQAFMESEMQKERELRTRNQVENAAALARVRGLEMLAKTDLFAEPNIQMFRGRVGQQ